MSTEHHKQLVLRWKEELWGKRNLHIIDELLSPDYVGHISGLPDPGPIQGREAFKHQVAAYLSAFEIQDIPMFLIAEGDLVVIHDTYRAKHIGEFQGGPPTGKEATVTGTDIYQMVDGKIVEQWVEVDMLGFLQQLGFLPTPGQGDSVNPARLAQQVVAFLSTFVVSLRFVHTGIQVRNQHTKES